MRPVSFDEACALVASQSAAALGSEVLPLAEAGGRVLAEDAIATVSNPPFDDSAMDGYAVRAAELRDARRDGEVRLRLSAELSAAGTPSPPLLAEGCAVRTLTGAPVPLGADAIVRQEATRLDGGDVVFWAPVPVGENIRLAGEDVAVGARLVEAGSTLRAAELAALGALGLQEVRVRARPRVCVVTLGDELVRPGQPLGAGQRYDCLGDALVFAARDAGAEASRVGPLRDEPALLHAALAEALRADVLLTAGGISVGDRDHVARVLEGLSVRWLFRGVRMRPGHPAAFGVGEHGRHVTRVFGLPGNPAAALCAFEVFARPALRRLGGHADAQRPHARATLTRTLEKRGGSDAFVRGRVSTTGAGLRFEPFDRQGAGMLSSMVGHTAWARVGADVTHLAKGASLEVSLLTVDSLALAGQCVSAQPPTPMVAFVGPSGAGKTTLLVDVITRLAARGHRVGALKHDAHGAQLDREGKDTDRLRRAGAEVAIVGPGVVGALLAPDAAQDLDALATRLFPHATLVLLEGFHDAPCPKILVLDARGPEPRDLAVRADVLATVGASVEGVPVMFARGDAEAVTALLLRGPTAWAHRE